MHQKLVLDSFLILANNPKQPLHARNSFENKYASPVMTSQIILLPFILLNLESVKRYKKLNISRMKRAFWM